MRPRWREALMDPAPCRPFDATRAGMNICEGAGILVLEDWERARRRGAAIYAELAGYALTCEAFHPTAPEPDGHAIAATIRLALGSSQTTADDVDHDGWARPHRLDPAGQPDQADPRPPGPAV